MKIHSSFYLSIHLFAQNGVDEIRGGREEEKEEEAKKDFLLFIYLRRRKLI